MPVAKPIRTTVLILEGLNAALAKAAGRTRASLAWAIPDARTPRIGGQDKCAVELKSGLGSASLTGKIGESE